MSRGGSGAGYRDEHQEPDSVPISALVLMLTRSCTQTLMQELEHNDKIQSAAKNSAFKHKKQKLQKLLQALQMKLTRFIVLVRWLSTASAQNSALQKAVHILNQSNQGFERALGSLYPVFEDLEYEQFPRWNVEEASHILQRRSYRLLPLGIEELLHTQRTRRSSTRNLLKNIDKVVYSRLIISILPLQFNKVSIVSGNVSLSVKDEFSVIVVPWSNGHSSWSVLSVDIHSSISLYQPIDNDSLLKLRCALNSKLQDASVDSYFSRLYRYIHSVCLMYQMDSFNNEAENLSSEFRLATVSYQRHRELKFQYWNSNASLFHSTSASSTNATLQIRLEEGESILVRHNPPLSCFFESTSEQQMFVRSLRSGGFRFFFEKLIQRFEFMKLQNLFEFLKSPSSRCPVFWRIQLLESAASEKLLQISMFEDVELNIFVDQYSGRFKVKMPRLYCEPQIISAISQSEMSLNSSPSQATEHLRSLQRTIICVYLVSLLTQCDYDASKHFPIDTPTSRIWVFTRVPDYLNYFLAISVDDTDSFQFHILKSDGIPTGSIFSLKADTNRPVNVTRILRRHGNDLASHVNDVRQRLHEFSRVSRYVISFQDILSHLNCSFMKTVMKSCSELAVLIELKSHFDQLRILNSISEDILIASPSVSVAFDDRPFSEIADLKIVTPAEDSKVNVVIRPTSKGGWRAEITQYSLLMSLLTNYTRPEVQSARNPFIDHRMCIYFSYHSCDKDTVLQFLKELQGFFDLAAVALYILSINANMRADVQTSNSGEIQIPRMFFQVFYISCAELRISYTFLVDSGAFVSQNAQRGGQTQRLQKQCEMVFLVSSSEVKKYSMKFRPEEFPQRMYFEERLNRNLVEGSKRVLLEVYRCHKGIYHIVYFRRLVSSCSERFNIFLTVELIPRSDNEIRCVYRGSDHSSFSTTIRMIHPNLFMSGDAAHTDNVSERLFQDLRAWYLRCGESERSPNAFLPLVQRQSDNGMSFGDSQLTLVFNDSCTLDGEEKENLKRFFSMSVNCPPYHRTRLVNFAKIMSSPFFVLREMLRLFRMELDTANIAHGHGAQPLPSSIASVQHNLLKIRNCLTYEYPMDWHYDSLENAVYIIVELFENIQVMTSQIRSLGIPRLFLPLRFSFSDRTLNLWRAVNLRRVRVNSEKLDRLLSTWDRNSLTSALLLLRSHSIAEVGSLPQLHY